MDFGALFLGHFSYAVRIQHPAFTAGPDGHGEVDLAVP